MTPDADRSAAGQGGPKAALAAEEASPLDESPSPLQFRVGGTAVASEHAVPPVFLLKEAEPAHVAKAKRLAAPRVLNRNINRRNDKRYKGDVLPARVGAHHRRNLRELLASLIRQRKLHHACGVIGVLLGLPYSSVKTGKGLEECWSDFAAAMEVLQSVDGAGSTDWRASNFSGTSSIDSRVRRMFRLLSRVQPNAGMRGKVHVELAHYLTRMGKRQAAYDNLRPTVDAKHNREDPLASLSYGLNSYCLWYENAVEAFSQQEFPIDSLRMESIGLDLPEGIGETDVQEDSDSRSRSRSGRPPRGNAVHEFEVRDTQDSSAVLREVRDDVNVHGEGSIEDRELDMTDWQVYEKVIYEAVDERGDVQYNEDYWRSARVLNSQGLDRRLFPVRVPQDSIPTPYIVPMRDARLRDLHSEAVKHLRQALASAPDLLPALLPLVQLLLAVHDIKGAVDEINNCSRVLNRNFIPPSIKAALLESLEKKDPSQLAQCHRDVLERNPLSVASLRALIKLHDSGQFETQDLLECLCLHLDVHAGALGTWRKLASCLIEEPANLSVQESSGDAGVPRSEKGNPTGGVMRHQLEEKPFQKCLLLLFSSRYKFWRKKNFSPEVIAMADQINGTLQILVYKAACAAHIYGPGEPFVKQACATLEKQSDFEGLDLVEHHCARSLKLFME